MSLFSGSGPALRVVSGGGVCGAELHGGVGKRGESGEAKEGSAEQGVAWLGACGRPAQGKPSH